MVDSDNILHRRDVLEMVMRGAHMCDMEGSIVGHCDPEQALDKARWKVNSILPNTVALVGSHANNTDKNYYIIQEKDTSSLKTKSTKCHSILILTFVLGTDKLESLIMKTL